MRSAFRVFLVLLGSIGCAGYVEAQAGAAPDAMAWLHKIAAASRQVNYAGTFVYQHGNQTETSRIAHLVNAGGEFERLEILDGPPREILRNNENVTCYLPETKTVVIEKRMARRFPVALPEQVSGISDNYVIRKGRQDRVGQRRGLRGEHAGGHQEIQAAQGLAQRDLLAGQDHGRGLPVDDSRSLFPEDHHVHDNKVSPALTSRSLSAFMIGMKVKVRVIGGFIQKLGFSEKELELPEPSDADGLAARLGLEGIPVLVSRDGAALDGRDRLKDGDRVLVSAMFSGG